MSPLSLGAARIALSRTAGLDGAFLGPARDLSLHIGGLDGVDWIYIECLLCGEGRRDVSGVERFIWISSCLFLALSLLIVGLWGVAFIELGQRRGGRQI